MNKRSAGGWIPTERSRRNGCLNQNGLSQKLRTHARMRACTSTHFPDARAATARTPAAPPTPSRRPGCGAPGTAVSLSLVRMVCAPREAPSESLTSRVGASLAERGRLSAEPLAYEGNVLLRARARCDLASPSGMRLVSCRVAPTASGHFKPSFSGRHTVRSRASKDDAKQIRKRTAR